MTLHSLPLFVRLAGRPVILVGEGEAADAKRRLLDRAGAVVVGEDAAAALAIVAIDSPDDTVARLRARGVLVNAVDRPDLCDFTLPAIVDRAPVIVAMGTGGASAGLAAALRQRLEALLPAGLGALAERLFAMRGELRARYPEMGERRRAIAAMLAEGGEFDPLAIGSFSTTPTDAEAKLGNDGDHAQRAPTSTFPTGPRPSPGRSLEVIPLTSPDPDDLTLRQARVLANADRVYHGADVPRAILNRARADAARIACAAPPMALEPGLSVDVRMA
ncbi:precorrin-2 dehydrogenase/sirohydrochlorin ferrochelatase family protein [Sphingomonas oligophenolica]|uniref:precorrin-2 dehydrogenase n=1 Tax=Sphingomonas oligophenolica TaxID=301154 RepID=A0A502CRW3_9SPHN|nr:NAD(P)-dependent oxidoreductase [Sphingomonas oligophenolica]TPG15414.1 siroheme synthase [Sphingomonas oligophenolica]